MTNGVTNLDILELSVPSIEADEIHSGDAAAGALLTADGNGGADWQAPAATYKTYTAYLSQTGTDAPVATVFENTLGGEVVWTRVDPGDYRGALAGAFTSGKTFLPYPWAPTSAGFFASVYRLDANTIVVQTVDSEGDGYDTQLQNHPVQVFVYL